MMRSGYQLNEHLITKLTGIMGKFKSVYMLIKDVEKKANIKYEHLAESELHTLNELLKRNDKLCSILESSRYHPTFDEVLESDRLHALPALLKNYTYPHFRDIIDNESISSQCFIELIQTDDQAMKLFDALLAKKTIQCLLADKRIDLLQLYHATDTQKITLSCRFINRLLAADVLSVEDALELSSAEREKLTQQTFMRALCSKSISLCEALVMDPTLSFDKIQQYALLKSNKIAQEKLPVQDPEVIDLIKRLDAYIHRIESHKTNVGTIDFKYQFIFCFLWNSQAANRKANYDLAKELRWQLTHDVNCQTDATNVANIFSAENIRASRLIDGSHDHGINSNELNGIIRDAHDYIDRCHANVVITRV
tara:strand:- start:42 stop:1142 length:1101 start_codon:yes stop_codon:yes gene_type:complete